MEHFLLAGLLQMFSWHLNLGIVTVHSCERQWFLPCLTIEASSEGVGIGMGGKPGMPKSISSPTTNPNDSSSNDVTVFNCILAALLNWTDWLNLNQLTHESTKVTHFFISQINVSNWWDVFINQTWFTCRVWWNIYLTSLFLSCFCCYSLNLCFC